MLSKRYFVTLLILFLCGIAAYLLFFSPYVAPWSRKEAIQTTLDWGGFAKIPVDHEKVGVTQYGDLFTREFVVRFRAHPAQIHQWIQSSKRLKDVTLLLSGQTKVYDIHPGEHDAFGGTVEVKADEVVIRMSWS